jgi:glycosyltransferase involved in cell wall biosynthesis
LEVARGDRVLMLDADLQDPPELLPDMMAMMDTGYDVVYGVRLVRHGEGIAKRATAHLFYRFLNWLSDVPIPKDTGDFRLVNRRALDAVLAMPERSRFVRGMFAWVGFAQIGLTYERQPRRSGETKYDLAAMSRLAWDAITGFSSHPLRIAMRMAVFCGFLSVALILYVFTTFASGNTVPGWASIVTAVSFFSAIQLFVLAVIGEYLGRIYIEEKARPLYFVSGRVGFAKKPMN